MQHFILNFFRHSSLCP